MKQAQFKNKARKSLAKYLNGLQFSSLMRLYNPRAKTFSRFHGLKAFYALIQGMPVNDVVDIVDKIYNRRLIKIGQKTYIEKINKHLEHLAEYLPSSGYTMGEMKILHLSNKLLTGTYDSTREYAKSCPWRARHGMVEVTLPNSYRNAQIIGNVITLINGATKYKGVYKAEWLDFENAKYINYSEDIKVKIVHGYIYKTFHATKLTEIFAFKKRERIIDKNKRDEKKSF